MKILRNTVIILVLILLVVIACRDLIIRIGMEQGMKAVTGMKLTIDSFDLGLFKPMVSIKGLKLYNPQGYTDTLMADVPEIYCEYKPMQIFKGQIAIKEFRLNLQELVVVHQNGQWNINELKALQPKGNGGPPPKFSIDDMTLNIAKVTLKDDMLPLSRQFNVNISEHYTNISGADQLVRLVITSALSKTTIAGLHLDTIKQSLPAALLNSITAKGNFLQGLWNNLKTQ